MTKLPRVLVVEDEPAIRELLRYALAQAGFDPVLAGSAEDGLREIHAELPAVLLLDLMLPGQSGIGLARQLRAEPRTRNLPILMVTAKAEEADKVAGLDVGADDYLTKPFSPKELMARIKAVIRRVAPTSLDDVIDVQGLKLDPVSHRVTVEDTSLDMGPTEFRLLHFFMTHPERVYSREQLLDHVWGTNVYVEDRTVDVHIRRLRKAISEQGHDRLIQTVRGSGYRFSVK